jgi:drug/metabolite transporter (DMT)-like permease
MSAATHGIHMVPRWLIWTVATLLAWGIWAILAKQIGDALSPSQSQMLSTLGLLPILAALALNQETQAPRNRRRGIILAFGSGVVSCIGNIPYYTALGGGAKAATVVPLTSLYPLVTVLLAAVLLKERLNWMQAVGVVLSLVAIYLFNVPDEQGYLSQWIVLALVSILLWGAAALLQKMATNDISGAAAALWFLIAFAVVGGGMLVYEPLPDAVPLAIWLLVVGLGFMLALGNFTILLAFASGGKASIITPMTGLYPLVSIPIAILALDETMNWRESAGVAFAVAGVVTLSWESRPAAEGHSVLLEEERP